jgi:hypothetical protein
MSLFVEQTRYRDMHYYSTRSKRCSSTDLLSSMIESLGSWIR